MTSTDSRAESRATAEEPRTSRVAVIGGGYMGGGIAQVFAMHGHRVSVADQDADISARAVARLCAEARSFETAGLIEPGAGERIVANLRAAKSLEDAVGDADYVTEAVPEVPGIKAETLRRIFAALPPNAVVGSNTSAIPISELAASVSAPQRFLGVHWMNPAPFVPGVELIPSEATSASALAFAEALIASVGKSPTRVADSPGFVANRLQFALFKEAATIVEEGLASPEQVDAVVRSTFGFRLALFGPFTIGDMAGLDVYRSSYETLAAEYGDRFAAPGLLADAVDEGNLGLKSGVGLIERTPEEAAELVAYRDHAYSRLQALLHDLGSSTEE